MTAVFGPGLGEGAGLGAAGVLRPAGIGGRMGLMLDPGRLSEDGDATAARLPASGWETRWLWTEDEMISLI